MAQLGVRPTVRSELIQGQAMLALLRGDVDEAWRLLDIAARDRAGPRPQQHARPRADPRADARPRGRVRARRGASCRGPSPSSSGATPARTPPSCGAGWDSRRCAWATWPPPAPPRPPRRRHPSACGDTRTARARASCSPRCTWPRATWRARVAEARDAVAVGRDRRLGAAERARPGSRSRGRCTPRATRRGGRTRRRPRRACSGEGLRAGSQRPRRCSPRRRPQCAAGRARWRARPAV